MIMPISKGFILKHVGNEYMIIPTNETNVKLDTIYNINESAAYIYEKLCEGLNAKQISNKMCVVYVADPMELETDILEFIGELKKRGIYYD